MRNDHQLAQEECNVRRKLIGRNLLGKVTALLQLTARSKAWVCCRSLAGIVGSNPAGGMDVCRECCVLSGRGLCDWLITRPEEYYRLWCVVTCDLENLVNEEAVAHWGEGGGGWDGKRKQHY